MKEESGQLDGAKIASVGYFESRARRFVEVGQTTLWSWQLGARLCWVPGAEKKLAYNAMIEGRPCFVASSATSKPKILSDIPLFDVNFESKVGLSLNFGRLAYARPGYGYPALLDPFVGIPLPADDGLIGVDLTSGDSWPVVSLTEISQLVNDTSRKELHYINAAKLSRSSKRYSVLYKTIPSLKNPENWDVHAVVGTIDGKETVVVPLPGRASHYWWIDDHRVLFTSNNGFSSEYLVYNCLKGSLSPLSRHTPSFDGHPSLCHRTGKWVTDSYPDLFGDQRLLVFDMDGGRTLSSFQASTRYANESRCDLHPRWNRDGNAIFFDSTHDGNRSIYKVDF
ncbi:hypothetical protein [Aliiroseovarius subalbicans]|uniref:hypothetical protein n=1 Tax=Aliiroseovarius subalbicans TaxID=2925840 RepID=UPI001F55B8A4|nr:hypothetical protein [Aliiroseovarius subalbicans]MCI2398183.1 hypothetical protein [Aliiroseovarius subalbicans]